MIRFFVVLLSCLSILLILTVDSRVIVSARKRIEAVVTAEMTSGIHITLPEDQYFRSRPLGG